MILLRIPIIGFLFFLSFSFSLTAKNTFSAIPLDQFIPLFWGLGFYILFFVFLKIVKQDLCFFQTFSLELNHAVFGLLFFKKMNSFQVFSKRGGRVSFEGKGNLFIALAPYSVPLFALFVLLFRGILISTLVFPLQILIFFFLIFHWHSLFIEFRPYQSDLKEYGFIFSLAFVLFMNISLGSWIFLVAIQSYNEAFLYLQKSILEIPKNIEFIKSLIFKII